MLMTERIASVYPHKLRRLYWPFLALAEACREVIGTVAGSFRLDDLRYTIPRFTFLGPVTSRPQQRVALFALLRGDEPSGASVLLRLLQTLVEVPHLATGYDLVCYPVCNPTGYEDDAVSTRGGTDVERELWSGSREPEVRILEDELLEQRFSGLVTLHSEWVEAKVRAAPGTRPRPFEQVAPIPAAESSAEDVASAHLFIQVLLDEYRERGPTASR